MNKVKIVCRALITDSQNRVLFVKKNNSDFWILPGGKLETDDISVQACLIRELQEELGTESIIKDIYFVQELHRDDARYVELIWRAILVNDLIYTHENISEMTDHELVDIQWIKKDNLHDFDIKPKFLKDLT